MSSINQQIDAAVMLMKARAAEFDNEREMDDDCTLGNLLDRAMYNVSDAIDEHAYSGVWEPESIVDCMNLCALALSLLADGEGTEG